MNLSVQILYIKYAELTFLNPSMPKQMGAIFNYMQQCAQFFNIWN
jgi:hypothetical protein